MTSLEKFEQIVGWYTDNASEAVRGLAPQADFARVEDINALIGDTLPPDISVLFAKYDGESGDGAGAFLGHGFMSLQKIIDSLEFSKSLVKPAHPTVPEPDASGAIIDAIIKIHTESVTGAWHKLKFECGPNSYEGPYVYPSIDTSEQTRQSLELPEDRMDEVYALSGKLHDLEHSSYKWDELKITVFGDGTNTVERTFYDFDQTLPLTSQPPDAILKKYYHIKWVPIIEDHGGNYIGVDLDPGPKGTKAQIIVFGRDEEDMYVMANSWGQFLDRMITELGPRRVELLGDSHLHDMFKPAS